MPGEAATAVDGGLFPAPVLQGLQRWHCRGVHVLPATAVTPGPDWQQFTAGPHGETVQGWAFGWNDGAGRPRRLLLEFAVRDDLPASARTAIAGYLQAVAALTGAAAGSGGASTTASTGATTTASTGASTTASTGVPAAGDADTGTGTAALVDRGQMRRLLHDLRNGLNSLLMNAAVLATRLPPAERDSRFARQVEADGERCAALLQALSDAVRPPAAPLVR